MAQTGNIRALQSVTLSELPEGYDAWTHRLLLTEKALTGNLQRLLWQNSILGFTIFQGRAVSVRPSRLLRRSSPTSDLKF